MKPAAVAAVAAAASALGDAGGKPQAVTPLQQLLPQPPTPQERTPAKQNDKLCILVDIGAY